MEASHEKMQGILGRVLADAIDKVSQQGAVLSDMYVQVVVDEEVTLSVYDDADNLLVSQTLECYEEWKSDVDEDDEMTRLAALLTETVNAEALYARFKALEYNGPFSLLLVDENMEIVSEVLTIDDENILLSDDLWEKMDRELDDFFEKLMSDVRYK